MKPLKSAVLLLSLSACSGVLPLADKPSDPSRSTVKIQAIAAGGKQNLGSGVVIAPDIVATNCHVIRRAKRAFIIQPERLYRVLAEAALQDLDVCVLKTENLNLPTAVIAESETIKIGDDIILSGYPFALSLRMKRGKITGLHPFKGGKIIEINAGFNHGASGGGVFDVNGQLVGLMTFMGPEANSYHFYAIPATWLALGLEQEFYPVKPLTKRSFWEKGEFIKEMPK